MEEPVAAAAGLQQRGKQWGRQQRAARSCSMQRSAIVLLLGKASRFHPLCWARTGHDGLLWGVRRGRAGCHPGSVMCVFVD